MAVWTDYDPLKEIIVGNCPTADYFKPFLSADVIAALTPILKETKEDLDNMQRVFESLGVKVYRPKILPFQQNLKLPGFSIKNAIAPIVPRDQYLVYGDTIIQSYTSMPDRWLEGLCFYDIFNEKFDEGYNWISVPPPVIKNFPSNTSWFTHGGDRYKIEMKDKLLWHAATMFKIGDSLIVNNEGPGTAKGYEWFKRQLPQTKFVNNIKKPHRGWGHIDQYFFMVNDTTCFCTDENYVPEAIRQNPNIKVHSFGHLIKDVDLHSYDDSLVESDGKFTKEWIDEWVSEWRGFAQDVAFDSNVVVVDEKNIVISNEQPKLQEWLLKNHGVTAHVAKQRQGGFWDGGVHCLTLDIKRDGVSRNVLG